MRFPFFDTQKPISEVRHNDIQKKALSNLANKIKQNEYKFVENKCLCSSFNDNDILVAKYDRHGIAAESVLCNKCGIVRLKKVFDTTSMKRFYEEDYRKIYSGIDDSYKENLKFKLPDSKRGLTFIALLKKIGISNKLKKVFDFGCGSGHVLVPFYRHGIEVLGYDQGKGFITLTGDLNGIVQVKKLENVTIADASQDLVIMSHIMEHLADPIHDLMKLLQKIKPGGFLLVEVPGLFWKSRVGYYNSENPVVYFQNAHVVQFYHEYYLRRFFEQLGLHVLYGDERCTFVLQKPFNYSKPTREINFTYDKEMQKNAKHIKQFLKFHYLQWRFHHIKNKLVRIKYKILGKIIKAFNFLGIKK